MINSELNHSVNKARYHSQSSQERASNYPQSDIFSSFSPQTPQICKPVKDKNKNKRVLNSIATPTLSRFIINFENAKKNQRYQQEQKFAKTSDFEDNLIQSRPMDYAASSRTGSLDFNRKNKAIYRENALSADGCETAFMTPEILNKSCAFPELTQRKPANFTPIKFKQKETLTDGEISQQLESLSSINDTQEQKFSKFNDKKSEESSGGIKIYLQKQTRVKITKKDEAFLIIDDFQSVISQGKLSQETGINQINSLQMQNMDFTQHSQNHCQTITPDLKAIKSKQFRIEGNMSKVSKKAQQCNNAASNLEQAGLSYLANLRDHNNRNQKNVNSSGSIRVSSNKDVSRPHKFVKNQKVLKGEIRNSQKGTITQMTSDGIAINRKCLDNPLRRSSTEVGYFNQECNKLSKEMEHIKASSDSPPGQQILSNDSLQESQKSSEGILYQSNSQLQLECDARQNEERINQINAAIQDQQLKEMNKQVLQHANLIISRDMINKNKSNPRIVRQEVTNKKQRVKSPSPMKRTSSIKKIDKQALHKDISKLQNILPADDILLGQSQNSTPLNINSVERPRPKKKDKSHSKGGNNFNATLRHPQDQSRFCNLMESQDTLFMSQYKSNFTNSQQLVGKQVRSPLDKVETAAQQFFNQQHNHNIESQQDINAPLPNSPSRNHLRSTIVQIFNINNMNCSQGDLEAQKSPTQPVKAAKQQASSKQDQTTAKSTKQQPDKSQVVTPQGSDMMTFVQDQQEAHHQIILPYLPNSKWHIAMQQPQAQSSTPQAMMYTNEYPQGTSRQATFYHAKTENAGADSSVMQNYQKQPQNQSASQGMQGGQGSQLLLKHPAVPTKGQTPQHIVLQQMEWDSQSSPDAEISNKFERQASVPKYVAADMKRKLSPKKRQKEDFCFSNPPQRIPVNKSQKFQPKENGLKLSNFAGNHHNITIFDSTKFEGTRAYPNMGIDNGETHGLHQDFTNCDSRERLYTEYHQNQKPTPGLPISITSSASSDAPRTQLPQLQLPAQRHIQQPKNQMRKNSPPAMAKIRLPVGSQNQKFINLNQTHYSPKMGVQSNGATSPDARTRYPQLNNNGSTFIQNSQQYLPTEIGKFNQAQVGPNDNDKKYRRYTRQPSASKNENNQEKAPKFFMDHNQMSMPNTLNKVASIRTFGQTTRYQSQANSPNAIKREMSRGNDSTSPSNRKDAVNRNLNSNASFSKLNRVQKYIQERQSTKRPPALIRQNRPKDPLDLGEERSPILLSQSSEEESSSSTENFGPSEFQNVKVLGAGSFGVVNLVQHKKTWRFYAQKIIQKEHIPLQGKQIEHILNEKSILKELGQNEGQSTVRMLDTYQDDKNLYILMEYLSGGDLTKVINKNKFKRAGPEIKFYLAEVLLGLEQLHNRNIAYRDLKPENILIDQEGHCRLIDFGFSKKVEIKKEEVKPPEIKKNAADRIREEKKKAKKELAKQLALEEKEKEEAQQALKLQQQQQSLQVAQALEEEGAPGTLEVKPVEQQDAQKVEVQPQEPPKEEQKPVPKVKKPTLPLLWVKTNCGTPAFAAPEVTLIGQRQGGFGDGTGAGYDGRAADIWSYGILMCELVGGSTPFSTKVESQEHWNPHQVLESQDAKITAYKQALSGKQNNIKGGLMNPQQILEKALNGDLNFPKTMQLQARLIIKQILQVDPASRPTIEEIKQSKFFSDIDWKAIQERSVEPPYVPDKPILAAPKVEPKKDENGAGNATTNAASTAQQDATTNKEACESPRRIPGKQKKILGDYHLTKINKIFTDF